MKHNSAFIRMKIAGTRISKIALGCVSNQGARNYQEDSFGFSSIENAEIKRQGFTAIVADGMGGLSGGAQISSFTVSEMLEMQKDRNPDMPVNIHLAQSFRSINQSVPASGVRGGTTCAAVMCLPVGIYWCTVGDSRIYLARDGRLTALNEDTDYLNRLIEQVISGKLSYEDAKRDEKKDALAQYIGYKGGIDPDGNSKPFLPEKGDKLLICSDGVYNALSAAELLDALRDPAQKAAEVIETRVLSKGYTDQDNFTAIIFEFLK